MKNLRLFIWLILLTGLMPAGCNRQKDPEEQRLSWSTESPLSIPYHTRFQRFIKKNLLRNPSFETGRTFKLDSTKTSFVIDGWQQVGQNIEWVDTGQDSLYRRDEAFTGYRAVKIMRRRAYETDETGDGVISDFIKVIPGNYSLSLYARLENIRPVKGRLGIKMYDAVDIRLLFFDKSKIAINPARPFPQLNQYIDNSFKSLSLANFKTIPAFGWGKIIGKSADFPYPDGDIPSNAHYVKIFIGLKGTGTMWIDNIDFSYSRKNFSVEETMQEYTDTSFKELLFIIPAPKKMERLESVIFFDPRGLHSLPVIWVPAEMDSLTRHAAEVLRKALADRVAVTANKNRVPEIRIVTAGTEPVIPGKGLNFVLGKTGISDKYRKSIPTAEIRGHSQGYYIYSPPDMPGLVFLDGNTAMGAYYAVLSAIQLIDARQPIFHNARIIDYPDFENRFYTMAPIHNLSMARKYAGFARQLEALKMNGAFYQMKDSGYNNPGIPMVTVREMINGPGKFNLGGIIGQPLDDPAQYFVNRIYAPEMILPEDSSLCYPFPVVFKHQNGLPSASGKPAAGNGNSTYPYFLMAPVFNNQLLDYSNYPEIAESNNGTIPYVYSGSSYFSLNTDDADMSRFIAFAGRKPVLMDNSMLASSIRGHYGGAYPFYSGKIRLYNILEPFLNTGIHDYFDQLDTTLFWVNNYATSEIDVIRLSTAADFIWNFSSYDPDYSLWKVLKSRYGENAARAIIHYADQYGLMLEIDSKLIKDEPLPRNLKNIQGDLLKLLDAARSVERLLGRNHLLVKEISSLNETIRSDLQKFIKPVKPGNKPLKIRDQAN